MSFYLHINKHDIAKRVAENIQLGKRFLFSKDAKYLQKGAATSGSPKAKRLLLDHEPDAKPGVKALRPGGTIRLSGMKMVCSPQEARPLSAVVPDRDLYQAEKDKVNLFVVYPKFKNCKSIVLEVFCNGESYCSLDIKSQLENNKGVALESLSMLLAGRYAVQLLVDDSAIGENALFTVARYQLAPMEARIFQMSMDNDLLDFQINVSSYEMPWNSKIELTLMEQDREHEKMVLSPEAAGFFSGQVALFGEGPYKLRIMALDDPSKSCEIALAGSGQSQRQATVISELGSEYLFSLLPLPDSVSVRGGFVQKLEAKTAIELNDCITDSPVLHINKPVEEMAVLTWSIEDNRWKEHYLSDLKKGDKYTIPKSGKMMMVFVGAWVEGQPFEGYGTVFSAEEQGIQLSSAESLRPGETLELQVKLKQTVATPLPVYLTIRDNRLTASEKPQTALATCLKHELDSVADEYMDYDLDPLSKREEFRPIRRFRRGLVYSASARPVPVKEGPDLDPFMDMESDLSNLFLGEAEEAGCAASTIQEEKSREEMSHSLFTGLVYIKDELTIPVELNDNLGRYTIEAFAYDDGNWFASQHGFKVDMPVRADLDFPPVVYSKDKVFGRIRAHTSSGKATLQLKRNGEEVYVSSKAVKTPFEYELPVQAGAYVFSVSDPKSNEQDQIKITVDSPGKSKMIQTSLKILGKGEIVSFTDYSDPLSLKLLPGLELSNDKLIKATASYSHLCCEQTAAKILSACTMYALAKNMKTRSEAEDIILAGVEREKSMITDKGFLMYPDYDSVNEYYSKLAVQYLWQLKSLQQASGMSASLTRAINDGLSYADRAAKFHQMQKTIKSPKTMAEAWALACEQPNSPAIRKLIDSKIELQGKNPKLKQSADPVEQRTNLAYAAACLLKQKEISLALILANEVMQSLNEEGRLYSTVDSVALIAMMSMLKGQEFFQNPAKLKINGQPTDPGSVENDIESVEVLEGIALVQIKHAIEHDFLETNDSMAISVALSKENPSQGETTDLTVKLKDGYVNGDIISVDLPAALSKLEGGGRVKQLSIDFAGKDEITIPLIVTGKLDGPQHFCVLVRNMFEENRIACPGMIRI